MAAGGGIGTGDGIVSVGSGTRLKVGVSSSGGSVGTSGAAGRGRTGSGGGSVETRGAAGRSRIGATAAIGHLGGSLTDAEPQRPGEVTLSWLITVAAASSPWRTHAGMPSPS